MVSPTICSPRCCSIPATTELSTPPDIATAMVRSRIRGGHSAQCRDALDQRLGQCVHLYLIVRSAQRKAYARPSLLLGQAYGGEPIRQLLCAAPAARPARN